MCPNTPRSQDRGPLRHAWKRWEDLQREVTAFLACGDVQRALKEDAFRTVDFQRPWEMAPEGVNVQLISKMYDEEKITDLATLAAALRAMANQTQKYLARNGAPSGMRETAVMQEWMNLLLDGDTPRGHYKVLEHFIPNAVRTIEDFRVHAIVAIEILLKITKGELDPDRLDPIVTKTHGLYIVGTDLQTKRQATIQRASLIGTEEQLKQGYRYGLREGPGITEADIQDKVRRRIQGAFFRALQMRELGTQTMEGLRKSNQWRWPNGNIKTVLLSEVCTEPEILKGTTPTFFRGQWRIGTAVPREESIDLKAGSIRKQMEPALKHIVSTIVHQDHSPSLADILHKRGREYS